MESTNQKPIQEVLEINKLILQEMISLRKDIQEIKKKIFLCDKYQMISKREVKSINDKGWFW